MSMALGLGLDDVGAWPRWCGGSESMALGLGVHGAGLALDGAGAWSRWHWGLASMMRGLGVDGTGAWSR